MPRVSILFSKNISLYLARALFLVIHASCTVHDSGEKEDAAGNWEVGGDTDSVTDGGSNGDVAPECDPSDIVLTSAKTSAAISTVGIIEWSTAMKPVTSAFIEFGLDSRYGYSAPVDLSEPNYRTLLLGMKPSRTYHYRIVVNGCAGRDHAIDTGAVPMGLPSKSVSDRDAMSSARGFIVTSTGMKSNYAYILDKDGDYVWWYAFRPDSNNGRMDGISRARLSADGKSMWAGSINVACGCGYLFKIPMDGIGTSKIISVDCHHDFTVLPDDTVAYIAYTDDGDQIVERNTLGEIRTVYSLNSDFEGSGVDWSHCNAIHYYPRDDSYTVSCLGLNNVIKIDRSSGDLKWNLDGDMEGDFSGFVWNGQHGHQILENGNILMFANNGVSNANRNESADTSEEFSNRIR